MVDIDDNVERIPVIVETGFKDTALLNTFPWSWDDESVDEFKCVDAFCYVPAHQRPIFMDELYRILSVGGRGTIIVPYYATALAVADYAMEWPPLSEHSFLYFNKKWREANSVSDRPIKADFDFTYGYLLEPDIATRATEQQADQVKHHWNVAQRLQMNLIKV